MSFYNGIADPSPLLVGLHNIPPPTSPHYRYHAHPTPRIGTYNICGYSARTPGARYVERRRKLLANMTAAMKNVDAFGIQETKLQTPEVRAHFKRDWYVFRNPCYKWEWCTESNAFVRVMIAAGGTDMYVRISFAHNFRLKHTIVVQGYAHYVTFEPRKRILPSRPYFSKTFQILNVYLPVGSAKKPVLRRLRAHPMSADYIFAAGDWNVRTLEGDSSTGKASPSGEIRLLNQAMADHGLEEVFHPAKTKISKHEVPHASRLDKHYSTHNQAEREVMIATVVLPPHPSEPGRDPTSPSDHFPVAVSYLPHDHVRRGKFTIPRHVVRHPSFAEDVSREWEARVETDDPTEELLQLEILMTTTARRIMSEQTQETEGRLEATTLALSAYKSVLDDPLSFADIASRCERNSRLRDTLGMTDSAEGLREALEGYIHQTTHHVVEERSPYQKTRSTYERRAHSYAPAAAVTGRDYHTNIRACVGSRNYLTHLVNKDGNRTQDPEEMARELKSTWEPIWEGSPAGTEAIDCYLRSYEKRIASPIPEVTIDDVIAEVLRPRSSCPGPNGIPFLAYAVLCDIAAPILLAVIQHLMAGGAPKSRFNWCRAFFLPKDTTFTAKATRPIVASNTANRIVANIIRRILEPHILPLLHKNQTGFVRGRLIDEHIRFFNEKYYSALYTRYSGLYPGPGLSYEYPNPKKPKEKLWWSQDDCPEPPSLEGRRDYHILFLDFAKAFDSVSRDYLMALLERIGIPESYRNVVWALYHNVKAEPSVGGKVDVLIDMIDGLKQGCPMSTLFYILALDPLIEDLSKLPDLDERAFADDTAMGVTKLRALAPAFPLIDCWTEVSRCRANIKKTKILSTSPERVTLDYILPYSWRGVTYADRYVYLGVLMGNSVDATMIMEAALNKFDARLGSYMPARNRFSLANRVKIANTYLIPVFSYLFRFFLATVFTVTRIERGLRAWLIKGNCTNLDRLRAPTHQVGLRQPLVNHVQLNQAALLRDCPALPPLDESHVGSYSLLMGDHKIRAAERYRDQVGEDFATMERQAVHTELLAHTDPRPLKRLLALRDTRERRHRKQGRPSRQLSVTEEVGFLVANSMALPKALTEQLRNHLFDITHSLLFTGRRTRDYTDDQSCRLCGYWDESVAHLFVTCPVAWTARDTLALSHDTTAIKLSGHLRGATIEHYELQRKMAPDRATALLSFSLAVWRTRWSYSNGELPPNANTAASQVISKCLSFYKHSRGYRRRDRSMEKEMFGRLLNTLPPGLHVYTDGSSYGNPGPAGSGFCVKDHAGLTTHCETHHLAHETNNFAEVDGIARAVAYLLEPGTTVPPGPIFMFVDNRQAIRVAMGRLSPPWCLSEAKAIRGSIRRLATGRRLHIYWVPGHAGVPGNDLADVLAKLGAAGVDFSGASAPDFTRPPPEEPPKAPAGRKVCLHCEKVAQEALGSRKKRGGAAAEAEAASPCRP